MVKALVLINEVALHRARLVLGWVTAIVAVAGVVVQGMSFEAPPSCIKPKPVVSGSQLELSRQFSLSRCPICLAEGSNCLI